MVRSAIALARAHPSGEPLKLRQVSDGMAVPRTFVSQILGDLVHAGLAVSSFGVRGGYRLARPPEAVSLLEVVEAGEGPLGHADCGLASSCPWRADCPLLDTFSAATVGLRATLTATTLADVVRRGWPVEAGSPCPARASEEACSEAVSPGRRDPRLPAPPGRRPAPPGRRPASPVIAGHVSIEDVVEHPVEVLDEGVTAADDRRPDGGGGERDHVPDHGDQRGHHHDSQGDREAAAHDHMVGPRAVPAEPGDTGAAVPGSHGGAIGRPVVRNSPAAAGSPVRLGGPITVVIVDDHALVREGSMQLLEVEPDIEVVGVAGTGEEGVDLLERLRPDVALVDINLPGMSGLELARQARDRRLPTRVFVVSAYDDYAYVTEALEVGVAGYLLKTASAQELIDSLRLVAAGVTVLDRAVSSRLRRRLGGGAAAHQDDALLTRREADVLQLLAEGCTNKEIAAALFLGLRTVESHVSNVLAKLGAASRTQAVAFALRHQLVHPVGDHRASLEGSAAERG